MTVALTPRLVFQGTAREAMTFYQSIFGGELGILTFEQGMGETNPDAKDLVMHASLYKERGIHLMGNDVMPGMPCDTNGANTLSSDGTALADTETLLSWWEGLQDGADVTMPMEQAPWGDRFGQLTDKFGIRWLVNISAASQE